MLDTVLFKHANAHALVLNESPLSPNGDTLGKRIIESGIILIFGDRFFVV